MSDPAESERLKTIGAVLAGQKSLDDVRKASRGSGVIGLLVALILGRLMTRFKITMEAEDLATVIGAIVAVVGYVGTHWRTTRTAGLLGAAADRIERDLRRDLDPPRP